MSGPETSGGGPPELALPNYELVDKLGEGGMGVVYRARDKRLEREVAIKVLPADREGDPERLLRFEREAKILAALNHPNIAAIYDVGEVGTSPYLVMELVEGQSLDRLIPRNGLDLDRLFDLATPLADAIAAAHDKGITHRDLKPSNVMVADDGRLKVLDFGLAKLRATGADEEETRTLPDSVTAEGKIVGTVAYMSPEQAEGKAVDHRSDIFSLGVILYEMTTGNRPFAGDSTLSTLTAILRDTPSSVSEVRRDLPRHLARIITHCLQKDPQRRYQSARDVVNELVELQREAESGELSEIRPSAVPSARRVPAGWLAAAAAIVAAVAAYLLLDREPSQDLENELPASAVFAERTRLTRDPGLESEPTWSPDGRFLAYTVEGDAGLDILIRPVDGGEPIPAATHAADDAQPAWSPDGSKLAFVSARGGDGRLTGGVGFGPIAQLMFGDGGDIYVQPAFGGTTVRVVDDGYYPAWSADGSRLAFMSPRDGPWRIWTIDASGGEPARLPEAPEGAYLPIFSPDGRWIAYCEQAEDSSWAVTVSSLDGGRRARLQLPRGWAFRPSWSPDGRWLYYTVGLADSADVRRSAFTADPEPNLGAPETVISGQGWSAGPSVSGDGRLAFSAMLLDDDIWEVDVATGEVRQVTAETSSEDYPDVSPDGETLLAVSNRTGSMELWTFDLEGRGKISVGPVLGVDFGGRWSPDGSRVAYTRLTEEGPLLAIQEVGAVSFAVTDQVGFGAAWSPDGQRLALARLDDPEEPPNLWVYSLASGVAERLTDSLSIDSFPSYSSDGRWIAFSREYRAGQRELWLKSVESGEERALLAGGPEVSHPRFSPVEPNRILFLRKHQSLWVMDIESGEEHKLVERTGTHSKLDYPSWGPRGGKIYFNRWDLTGDLFLAGPGERPPD